MAYFGCDSDDKKNDFLRVLLVYEKYDDVLKESPLDQVIFLIIFSHLIKIFSNYLKNNKGIIYF
jgi:hypothetical protein